MSSALLADPKAIDDTAVSLDLRRLQIVEQPAAPPDHFQEPASGMMVLRVGLEVLGEVRDPLAEKRDLDFG